MSTDRTLGVIGSLVWDRIVDRDGRSEPVEEWGGIGYALAALTASLPEGWTILPILKIGRDLAEDGRRFMHEIPRLKDSGVVVVPEPNNRVELRYESEARRCERLTGGVPPWTWPELAPFTEYQVAQDGKATAYVCLDHACHAPTTDPQKMLALLTPQQRTQATKGGKRKKGPRKKKSKK